LAASTALPTRSPTQSALPVCDRRGLIPQAPTPG
jgi:hypothetical protein